MVYKERRIRDPVHGLIVFSPKSEIEQLAWRLLDAEEFQRLRRIRQLGFSELVYPGATHTRFAHSIGAFHTGRSLVSLLKSMLGQQFSQDHADVATCAALLHDLGHGPFSHTFEGVLKGREASKKHEKWTVEIIRGDTEIGKILAEYDAEHKTQLREKVSALLDQEYPSDIYSSIVSSQLAIYHLTYHAQ